MIMKEKLGKCHADNDLAFHAAFPFMVTLFVGKSLPQNASKYAC